MANIHTVIVDTTNSNKPEASVFVERFAVVDKLTAISQSARNDLRVALLAEMDERATNDVVPVISGSTKVRRFIFSDKSELTYECSLSSAEMAARELKQYEENLIQAKLALDAAKLRAFDAANLEATTKAKRAAAAAAVGVTL